MEDMLHAGTPENAAMMNRREFLGRLGLGVAGAIVGMEVIADIAPSVAEAQDKAAPTPAKSATPSPTYDHETQTKIDGYNRDTAVLKAQEVKKAAENKLKSDDRKQQTDEENLRKIRIDNDNNSDTWHGIAEVLPGATVAITALGAIGSVLKWLGDRKDAEDKRQDGLEKDRLEREEARRKLDDIEFEGVQKNLLSKSEAKWAGADVTLLKFSQGAPEEYQRYRQQIFNVTRDILQVRHTTATKLAPSVHQSNIIAAFLGVLPALRHETAQRVHTDPSVAPLLKADGVNLNGANLIDEDLSRINLEGASFTGAVLDFAVVKHCYLGGTKMDVESATKAVFRNNTGLKPEQIQHLKAAGAIFEDTPDELRTLAMRRSSQS